MSAFPIDSRIIDSRDERRISLLVVAAAFSLIGALAHAWVVRSHVAHWWGYGAFFAGVALAQAAYAVVVVRYPRRRVAAAGVAANAGVLALYLWSRTVGVPMGPHSGKPESVGAPDLVAAGAEVALIVALLLIVRIGSGEEPRRAGRASVAGILVAVAAAGVVGPAGAGHPSARTPALITLADGSQQWTAPPSIPGEPPAASVETLPSEPAPDDEWQPPACVIGVAGGVTVPKPAGAGEARVVAYSGERDVWFYDPATDETKRVTESSEACWASHPSFRTANYISFTTWDAMYGLDLASGELDKLFESKYGLMSLAWSPDGKTLAYLTSWSGTGSDGGPQLVTYRPADGSTKVLRTFPFAEGGCGGEGGEVSVSWAPDGHALIVVITHLSEGETMFVVDQSGHDLVAPRSGTSGRWAPDSRRIYYRDLADDRKWHTLNSETGDTGTLGAMKPGTYELAVSPDGSMLAYHEGGENPATYVYAVATKTQRKLADEAVGAVWLGPRTLLVTETKSCGDECAMSAWITSGDTSIIDVITEKQIAASAGPAWFPDTWTEPLAQPEPTPPPAPTTTPSPSPAPSGEPSPEPTSTSSTSPSPDPSPTPTEG